MDTAKNCWDLGKDINRYSYLWEGRRKKRLIGSCLDLGNQVHVTCAVVKAPLEAGCIDALSN